MKVPKDKGHMDVLSIDSFNALMTKDGLDGIPHSTPDFQGDLVRLLADEAPNLERPELEEILDTHTRPEELKEALLAWVSKMSQSEASQALTDSLVQRYQRNSDEIHLESPLLIQIETLAEKSLEIGWNEDFEEVFELLINRSGEQDKIYESFPLQSQEWTIESFVGDYLLNNGLNLFAESLEDLVGALRVQDEATAEIALDWLAESFFYLDAAKEWSKSPWI